MKRKKYYYPDGGSTKDSGEEKTENIETLLKGNLSPKEQNFLYRNLMYMDNPLNPGEQITYGELFDNLRSPNNRDKVLSILKERGYTQNLEGIDKFTVDQFNTAKSNLKEPMEITRSYANAIEKDRANRYLKRPNHYNPKLDEYLEKEGQSYEKEQVDKYLLLQTPQAKEKLETPVGEILLGEATSQGQNLADGGQIVNVASSLLNTVGNIVDANNLQTTQTPALINRRRTPYRSSVEPTLNRNEATFRAIASDARGRGNAATTKALAYSSLLNSNTQAIQADTEAKNRFESQQDSMDLSAMSQNAQSTNQIGALNIERYNRKIASSSQARQAGYQDLINIDANEQARRLQRAGLNVELASSLSPEELERLLKIIEESGNTDILSKMGF